MTNRHAKSNVTDRPMKDRSRSQSATEGLLIGIITCLGIVLRIWQPHHLAVEHFDEGVYASNLFCAFNGYAYPFRHLYAPPLLPALLEWALVFSGGAAAAVMWVNVIAGCLMAPSMWWVARAWFGPLAGLAGGALTALSPIHIQYSRAALTDGLLCLWMLWGVYWGWKAILTGRPWPIVAAGLFASLAWWTKYNGWLTLAITGAGMAAWLIAPGIIPARLSTYFNRLAAPFKCAASPSHRGGDIAINCNDADIPNAGSALLRWGVVVVIAFIGWLPVLVALQDTGGYAAVAANHSRYFVGFGGLTDSFTRQAANLAHYHSWLTLVALLLAVFAFVLVAPTLLRLGGSFALPKARAGQREPANNQSRARALAGWMLAAWFIGLSVAVPLYSPYPRLTLPWVVAAWLAAGVVLSRLVTSIPLAVVSRWPAATRWMSIFLLLAAALLQGIANHRNHIDADRSGLQLIAHQIIDQVRAESHSLTGDELVVIRVLGEPGLFFHLAAIAHQGAGIASDLLVVPAAEAGLTPIGDGASVRVYLVSSGVPPAPSSTRLTPVEQWAYQPSDLVLLDTYGPGSLDDRLSLPAQVVRLERAAP